jgi:hypothetical protein
MVRRRHDLAVYWHLSGSKVMHHVSLGLVAALCLAAASPALAQSSVSIQFQDGRVTLSARNAPLRTILAEWARVGGSRIVNIERVGGAPLTIEIVNEPERTALATLLRGVGGHAAAARAATLPGTSSLDRIFLLTTPPLQQAASSSSSPTPGVQQSPVVRFIPGEPDDDLQADAAARRADVQRLRDEAAAAAAALRDAQDEADARRRPQQPATVPGFPGGVIPGGGGRPGEVAPAARPQSPDSDEP